MSVHDGQRIQEALQATGYSEASGPANADVVVLTTCSVREKARQKVHSAIGRMKRWKANKPGQVLVIAGCVAQQDGMELLDAAPHIDIVVGSEHLGRTAELVQLATERGERLCVVGFDEDAPTPFLQLGSADSRPISAYVTIQKGCDEGCAYCIVPTVRGPGRCRPFGEIVDDVAKLAEGGTREIVLLGQTVNSYVHEGRGFADLLRAVALTEGIERIRYESAHPKFLDDALIEVHQLVPQLCEHLHLPVQSGSDDVLRRMGRGHDRLDFLNWVEALRRDVPGVGISTDLFVGFPGESEQDFLDTLSLVEAARFDGAFSFKYSPRPGTLAAELEDDVSSEVKVERLHRLQTVQGEMTSAYLEGIVGQVVEVLVEGESKAGGQLRGRNRRGAVVNIDLPQTDGGSSLSPAAFIGRFLSVLVTSAGGHSLRAKFLEDDATDDAEAGVA